MGGGGDGEMGRERAEEIETERDCERQSAVEIHSRRQMQALVWMSNDQQIDEDQKRQSLLLHPPCKRQQIYV